MKQLVSKFYQYRHLLLELVIRDIKIKYKNSYVGVLWSAVNPLLMMIVLTIIFSQLFKSSIVYFPVYVLTGRFVYSLFSDATSQALDSVYSNGQLIKKVYVPKYFFPLTRTFSSFIINCVALIPIFIAMIFMGIDFTFYSLLVIFPVCLMLLISMGIGMLLSAIGVFFRDLKYLYSVFLTVIMYATPIFYPANIIPAKYHYLIELNPMYPILEMVRDSLMYGQMFRYEDVLVASSYSLISLLVGVIVFYKKQDRFIYYM